MAKIATIIIDNALSSQNQDILPDRLTAQREVVNDLITKMLDADSESLIGLIPLAQKLKNDILTPIKHRYSMSTFLYQIDLSKNKDHLLALFQAERSLYISELSEKILFIFLSSPIANQDDVFINLISMANKGVQIKIICFGDAIEFGECLKNESSFDNLLKVLIIKETEDFYSNAMNFFTEGNSEYIDQDLEEAIKRSMIEK